MKRYILFLLAWFPLVCLAAIPDVTLYIDVTSPNPQKFAFSVRAGNTPVVVVRCVTNLTTGGAYTGFGNGWTPALNYFMSDAASAGVIIPGTLDPATGIITFATATNSFPAQGTYFCEVYLNNGLSPKLTVGQGQLIVTRSPSSGSIGALNMSSIVNWDILVSRGTVPWAAGAEPVFFASAAYGIRSYDTNNWTTSYLDELLLRTQFNATSNATTLALGVLTTNLANEISRATNAETIISNTFNTAITNQAATNSAVQSYLSLTMTNLVSAYASTGSASFANQTLTITHGTNTGSGSGSGFPLTTNANLAGFTMSNGTFNGTFIGNGVGVTGLVASSTNGEPLWNSSSNNVLSHIVATGTNVHGIRYFFTDDGTTSSFYHVTSSGKTNWYGDSW